MKIIYLFFISSLFVSSVSNAQKTFLDTNDLPRNIYFYDDFVDDRNKWNNFNHSLASGEVKNGAYFLTKKDTVGTYRSWRTFSIDPTRTHYIETDFSVVSGPSDYGNGILFNHSTKKKENSYTFLISGTQYFYIYKTVDGVDYDVKDWTYSTIIKQKGKNKLAVFSKGSTTYFYINNKLVYQLKNMPFFGNEIGFFFCHSTTIAIDKFLVRYNPPGIDEIENAVQGYKKITAGQNINSLDDDCCAVLSADGKLMFFTRATNMGHLRNDSRTLMFTEYNEEQKQWSVPQALPANINQGGRPQVVYISPDKNTILINGTYGENGKYIKDGELSMSHKTENGWSNPEKIHIPGWENMYEYEGYSLSSGKKILIMAIQKKGGFGERDLYVSFNENGQWSELKNLGAVVNSYTNESSPCLAPDNVTLYYSSEGKPGYGSSDIFVTRRLDDTWQNWTEPKNLGPEINSPFWDGGLQVDAYGQYAYMDEYIDTTFKSEIYKIQIPESARPKPVVIVRGKIYDKKTKEPFSAAIVYENLDTQIEEGTATSSIEDGSFVLVLPYGINYGVSALAKGYISEGKNIDIKDSLKNGIVEVQIDLYLTPLASGEKIRLNNIFFDPDKFELKESSNPELDRLYELMNENPSLEIEIAGHTDIGSKGSSTEFLYHLSLNRAQSVMDYLVRKGISSQRITIVGYGNTLPVSTNQTLNRRVEVKIVSH